MIRLPAQIVNAFEPSATRGGFGVNLSVRQPKNFGATRVANDPSAHYSSAMRTSMALVASLALGLAVAACGSNMSCQSGPKGTQCYGPGQQTTGKLDPTVNNVAPTPPAPQR